MTIQNIEDVMERIMSLNRNLNEESLKTLLSASGWDREDIMEGLRIFRTKNKNTVVATPVRSEMVDPNKIPEEKPQVVDDKKELDSVTNNVYTFNLKNRPVENASKIESVETEDIVSPNLTKENNSANANVVNVIPLGGKTREEKSDDKNLPQNDFLVPVPVQGANITKVEENKSRGGFGKVLFYLLLLLILGALALYMLVPKFSEYVNQKLFNNKVTEPLIFENETQTNIPNPGNIPLNPNMNPGNGMIEPDTNTSSHNSNIDIEELRREIASLKDELEKYKNSSSEEKTVIKYISQRGPAGKNGRGITTVDATSTGFIINYTDGTTDIVPYSTTTILNILNSQNICFRDASSTPNVPNPQNPDVCLDRNSILDLINRR